MGHFRRGLVLGPGPDEKVASDFTSVPGPSARRLFAGEEEVQEDTDDCGEADAADGEGAEGEDGTADAHREGDGNDDDVTRLVQVYLVVDEVLNTHGGNGAEEQQHDATEYG